MKRLLVILTCISICFSLCGCGKTPEEETPKTETIELSLDNWESFFSIVCENEKQLDAQGNIDYIKVRYYLELLPEYENRVISLSGKAGIEYESVSHRITSVNKQDGTWIDEVSNDYSDKYSYVGESKPEDVSKQVELENKTLIGGVTTVSTSSKGIGTYTESGNVWIKDADNYDELWIFYPEEIQIVNLEGELIISS